MPTQKSWMPPKSKMMQMVAGKPATGSPQMMVLMKKYKMRIKAIRQNRTPTTEAMANGAVEKPMMPSMDYKSSFQNDHFVSPATRWMFSYSSHLVR